MYLAGKALGDSQLRHFASATLQDTLLKYSNRRFQLSAPLCHGLAGLLSIALRFDADEPTAGWRIVAEAFLLKLIHEYEPMKPYGYASINQGGVRTYHPGLLDGAGGIVLTLLSTMDITNPWWERLLLIA